MAFSFVDVYFRLLGTTPPTTYTTTTCGAASKGCPDMSAAMMVEALSQASKHELEELRALLAVLQRDLEPHIEAAGKEPRPPKQWEDPDSGDKQ